MHVGVDFLTSFPNILLFSVLTINVFGTHSSGEWWLLDVVKLCVDMSRQIVFLLILHVCHLVGLGISVVLHNYVDTNLIQHCACYPLLDSAHFSAYSVLWVGSTSGMVTLKPSFPGELTYYP